MLMVRRGLLVLLAVRGCECNLWKKVTRGTRGKGGPPEAEVVVPTLEAPVPVEAPAEAAVPKAEDVAELFTIYPPLANLSRRLTSYVRVA